jgi:hypothetical protein
LKGSYALELRFKTARATVDIDLTVQRISPGRGKVLSWRLVCIGAPVIDLDAAP